VASFVVICIDKPDSLALRLATREAHFAYARGMPAGFIRMGGPFLDKAGEMTGSMILVEAPDIEAVRAFNAADPYTLAGLFRWVEIRAWKQTFPAP
jgi:uncharacterized protein YciI